MTQTTETTKTIQMLPIEYLSSHPQNPRKDLGDLQELTDSIRENGILQNLTVTPWIGEVTGKVLENTYKVIIGHRRLAAAKLAGLTHVPCVVANMTPAEQIKTMLMENMQRVDLTPLEQADGFQMMMDLGVTLDEIARESGFSQTTVRRRLKLRELDRQILEERLTQGATLMDLVKLEQLEDEKVRNKVLKTVGTNNFEYELRKALNAQACKQNKPLWIELLDSFAQRITKEEVNSRKWSYAGWHSLAEDPKEYKKPEDTDRETYGYVMDSTSFSLRTLRPDADQIEGAEAERSELEQQVENMEEALEESSVTAYELRLEFVKATTLKKKHVPDAINYLLSAMGEGETPKIATLSDVLGIQADLDWKEKREARQEAYSKLLKENPDKALLFMAYAISGDDSNTDYVATSWRRDQFPLFYDNDRLNRLYDFLELLGYQISDEERLLMSGEHPAFAPGKEQQANEPDEDEDEYEEDADD